MERTWSPRLEAGALVRPGDVVLDRTVPGSASAGPGLEDGRACWLGHVVHDDGQWRVEPVVSLAPDGSRAHVDLRAAELEMPELREALDAAGVVYGVDETTLTRALELRRDRGTLPRPVCVAVGTPPVEAVPARAEWHARSSTDDATERHDHFVHLRAGERLATLHARREGRVGRRVDGGKWLPLPTEDDHLSAGEGAVAHATTGGLVLEADRDGVLFVADEEVRVLDLIEIEGDVDSRTGDLDVDGSVRVTGTVHEGYRVSASGDVLVEGEVEGGSVECGGSLTVLGSAFGAPGAVLRGRRAVTLHHAQNALVESDGDITVLGSDTGSEMTCHGRLEACEGRGVLRGGRYAAARGVRVKELGSPLGAETQVTAGAKVVLGRELIALRKAGRGRRNAAGKSPGPGGGPTPFRTTTLLPPDAAYARRAAKAGRAATGSEHEVRTRRLRLERAMAAAVPASIEVVGRVHAGVELRIDGASHRLRDALSNVRFEADDDELSVLPRRP